MLNCPLICLSFYLIYLFRFPLYLFANLSTYISVCLSVRPSIHPSTYLPNHPPTHPSIHPFTYLPNHPVTHPSIHLPNKPPSSHPSIHQSNRPSTHPSIHQYIHPSSQPASQPSKHLPVPTAVHSLLPLPVYRCTFTYNLSHCLRTPFPQQTTHRRIIRPLRQIWSFHCEKCKEVLFVQAVSQSVSRAATGLRTVGKVTVVTLAQDCMEEVTKNPKKLEMDAQHNHNLIFHIVCGVMRPSKRAKFDALCTSRSTDKTF